MEKKIMGEKKSKTISKLILEFSISFVWRASAGMFGSFLGCMQVEKEAMSERLTKVIM